MGDLVGVKILMDMQSSIPTFTLVQHMLVSVLCSVTSTDGKARRKLTNLTYKMASMVKGNGQVISNVYVTAYLHLFVLQQTRA